MEKRKKVSFAKYGYMFAAPFLLAWLVCMLYPVLYTCLLGFTDLKGMATTDWHILTADKGGLWKNYKDVFNTPTFITALKNTFRLWIVNFIPQILLALVLSAWFTNPTRKIKGQGFFKVMFYMPNIITAATIAYLFASLFGYPIGPVNQILTDLGMEPVNWLVKKEAAQNVVSFVQFWMWYGNTMIVLIAGILGINPELFEAASIDGATGTQQFFKITLPNLKTILLYTLVTSMVGGLQMFDIPRMYMNCGPDNATLTASCYIQDLAFGGTYQYAKASAVSMVMFAIIGVIAIFMFYILRDKDEAALRKIVKKQEKEYKKKLKAEAQGGTM